MSYEDQNSLNDLDVATPLDGASPQELLLAFRQLKAVVKNAFLVSHTPKGSLRDGSFSNLSPNSVGTPQILNESVTFEKLAASSVGTESLVDEAVTPAKLADGAVTEEKYAAESIPQTAYQSNTIPVTALAGFITANYLSFSAVDDTLRSVTELAIADNAVVDRAIKDVAVGKLTGGSNNDTLLKVDGTWIPVPFSGGVGFDPVTGQFQVNLGLKVAVIGDVKPRGVYGGANTLSGQWTQRTLGVISDSFDLLQFSSNRFKLVPGKYLYYIIVPACSVGDHQARLYNFTDSIPVAWGTPNAALSTNVINTHSVIVGFHEVTDSEKEFEIQHWMSGSTANVYEMGLRASSDATVVYPDHSEVYTVGYLIKIA